MTGVLNAMVGQSALTYTIDVADGGGGIYGARTALGSSFGGISPTRTVKGADFVIVWSIPSTVDLDIILTGVRAQDFFRYVAVQDGAGTIQLKTSASATHSDNGSETTWRWSGTGLWTAAHGSRLVTFYF